MDDLTLWIIIGVVLLIAEMLTVSFYSIFFGIGALVTALFVYIGMADDTTSQLLVFAVASMGSLLIFRKKLRELFFKNSKGFQEIVDDYAIVSHQIPSNGEGKVQYRGSQWIAYSDQQKSIEKGEKVKIVKIDGIKLLVDKP